ncbi:MAG TPA: DOMON-like domain-containing protein [Anaerolineales bacterium]|nr:DOMON-like domain-containing protein [Anaerolineales bacterium]
MTEQAFSLIPFPAPNTPDLAITGKISLCKNVLSLQYSLAGRVEDIFLPPVSTGPLRKDELWKTTCFEFFLAIKDHSPYWEFNLSPSGDWNVYHMDLYRRIGFREETLIQRLPFDFQVENSGYSLNVAVDLCPILTPEENVQAGIASIIQMKDGHETYWALLHPAPQADFHVRESFICSLQNIT